MPRIGLGEVTDWIVWELQAPVSCLTPVLAADLTGSVVPGLAESRGSLSLSQSLSAPGLSSQTMPQVPQTSWTHVTVDDIHTSDTPAAIFCPGCRDNTPALQYRILSRGAAGGGGGHGTGGGRGRGGRRTPAC